MVGTNWAWVTRWRSIRARQSSGSKRSMTTTAAPRRCIDWEKTSGAEWYSGAGHRYTESAPTPMAAMPIVICTGAAVGSPRGVPGRGLRTPLGRPVVPEE